MSAAAKSNPALALQMNVKQNAQELNAYLRDLQSWSSDVKKKDEALKSGEIKLTKTTAAPIRGAAAAAGAKAQPVLLPSSASADQARFAGAKAAGNAAFAAGRFDESLVHYSQCMLLAPKDAVIPSNRSQALLKLQRWHEAEVDASTALDIDPAQVKALFRRAQARRQLRKFAQALADCDALAKLDPTNKPAKALGVEVAALLKKQQEAKAKASQPIVSSLPVAPAASTAAAAGAAPVASRRMVIEEEDDSEEEEVVPIKTSSTTASPAKPASAAPAPVAAAPAAAPAAAAATPAAAAASSNPAASAPAAAAAALASPSSAAAVAAAVGSSSTSSSLRAPKTSYDFDSTFRSIRNDPVQIAAYFQTIPSAQHYAPLLKTALDGNMLKATLQSLVGVMLPAGELRAALTVLEGLSTVARFNTTRLMLDAQDKQAINALFRAFGEQVDATGATKEHITAVAARYNVQL